VSSDTLQVTTGFETDFWRKTSYGFVHDSAHALLEEFPENTSFEVTFTADFSEQFDQAGVLVRASDTHWIKCGVEYADGALGVGAVVTRDLSDWSTAPHSHWLHTPITVRVSRSHGALTIRAKSSDGPWRLVRLAPLDQDLSWKVGPFAATPSREGLTVTFTNPQWGPADHSLH
jgi:regulation of enolase protein 1 (concanavalin A-like superfamily)